MARPAAAVAPVRRMRRKRAECADRAHERSRVLPQNSVSVLIGRHAGAAGTARQSQQDDMI